MKKILFITPNKIFGKNGGSLGQKKIYDALKELNFDEYDFNIMSLDDEIDNEIFNFKKNKIIDILSRCFLHSNYVNLYWKQIKKIMKKNNYDIVILGNSKLGYIAKKIKNTFRNIKVIIHFDNVEYDYTTCLYEKSSLFKKKFELLNVKREEKFSMKYSNVICCLSKRDSKRLTELYNMDITKKLCIYPVCLKQTLCLKENQSKSRIIFVGTLNYLSNVNAIFDFLPIFNSQNYFDEFIIGGVNPDKKIIELEKNNPRIKLKINFKNYEDIAKKGDILVSFIKNGAGMKVKVAEAMSLGLLICGSSETFVGYEDDFKEDAGFFLCNSEKDFLSSFSKIVNLSFDEKMILSNKNIEIYKLKYSQKRSVEILKSIL